MYRYQIQLTSRPVGRQYGSLEPSCEEPHKVRAPVALPCVKGLALTMIKTNAAPRQTTDDCPAITLIRLPHLQDPRLLVAPEETRFACSLEVSRPLFPAT